MTQNCGTACQCNCECVYTYTVSFNINGGSGTTPPSKTVNGGTSITLPTSSGFSRSGYTFESWNSNSSGTGTNYSANSSYVVNNRTTLYAKWKQNQISSGTTGGGSGSSSNEGSHEVGACLGANNCNGYTCGTCGTCATCGTGATCSPQ